MDLWTCSPLPTALVRILEFDLDRIFVGLSLCFALPLLCLVVDAEADAMPKCCSCNSSGRCIQCCCVRASRRCYNCTPGQHDRCKNSVFQGGSQPVTSSRPELGLHRKPNAATCRRTSLPISLPQSEASSSSSSLPSTAKAASLITPGTGSGAGAGAYNGNSRVSTTRPPCGYRSREPFRSSDVGQPDASQLCTRIHPRDSSPLPAAPLLTETSSQQLATSRAANSADISDKRRLVLPPFIPLERTCFSWADLDGSEVVEIINEAYTEIVHWRRNVFAVPSGEAGKKFVTELARLFQAFADRSALEQIAIKAAMIMPALLLQKPHPKSKTKDHVACLTRRLAAWTEGRFEDLLGESRAIQNHLYILNRAKHTGDRLAHTFAKLMMAGRTASALRLLKNRDHGGLLNLSDEAEGYTDGTTVFDVLQQKHPNAQPVQIDSIASEELRQPEVHPIIFESITESTIRVASLRTFGSAGPSGLDADGWRRLCNSFRTASVNLRSALAATARRLCTEYVDPVSLEGLLSSRLIPLNKHPGIRPIGIGEVVRRIIGKAVLSVTAPLVQRATGSLQVCAGQEAGLEAAIHAIRQISECDSSEAVLLVDAKNAFNCLNRQTALININILCPSMSHILTNSYRQPSKLFVDGKTLLSCEGVTQGDPLAMAMYAIASIPLICKISTKDASQVWFADDATSGGKLLSLKQWWDKLSSFGPSYGYYVNGPKSYLYVKAPYAEEARRLFEGTGIQITTVGTRHLGSALGSEDFVKEFVSSKVKGWISDLECLVRIAHSEPHAAFCAYTHGFAAQWSYISRVVPNVGLLFNPLEDVIRTKFLPALLDRSALSENERELLALPARHGGMGLINPTALEDEYCFSKSLCGPLISNIIEQEYKLGDVPDKQRKLKSDIRREKVKEASEKAKQVHSHLPEHLQRPVQLAVEKGASSWLTTLPLKVHGFALHKSAFRDAVCLRYNWAPSHLPSLCVCGNQFTVSHALSCPTGGFPTIRHNELRDICSELLSQVCPSVSREPDLQPLTGEQFANRTTTSDSSARLDIAANGFWGGRFERTFFDVRVFNPFASSNVQSGIPAMYKRNEREKRSKYEARICEVEHATFTPLVWSTSGGAGPTCSVFMKRLASKLAEKREESYSATMAWLRCRICFALLRSAVMCLRGTRSSASATSLTTSAFVARAEGRISE